MVPLNKLPVPSVADDPTCQKTLQANAPLRSTTLEPDPITRLLLSWKFHLSDADPVPVRIKVPPVLRAAIVL